MRLGLLALALAATFAGCTCDKPKSDAAVDAAPSASTALTVADASSINACTYLSPADLEKTTGLLAPGNTKSSSSTNATCTWGSFDKKMVVLEIFATSAQYDQS